MSISDLTVEIFLLLRDAFFDESGSPKAFHLRDKRSTQDDPLDEYIAKILSEGLEDAICERASGPLITPDMTIYRPDFCNGVSKEVLRANTSRLVALEVKKLQRSASGRVARPTGMDYNTTPPCGTVRIYDAENLPLDIRGFYLFVTQERISDRNYILSALALCDGNILNEDFELYLRITSQREKEIGLGTYGNGANRNRPMLIFSNPLGATQLDHAATLVSKDNLGDFDSRIRLVYRIIRTAHEGNKREFFAYRKSSGVPPSWEKQTLTDPFPQPSGRVRTTQARGGVVYQ